MNVMEYIQSLPGMFKGNRIGTMLCFLILSISSLHAQIVRNERTDVTYTDLQTAINDAVNNDVLLLTGTFFGNFNNNSLSLILRGLEGAILDGNDADTVFTVCGDVIVKFENLVIQNGNGNYGGGIANNTFCEYCEGYSYNIVIVKDCIIQNNFAENGGGISNAGALLLVKSTVINNQADCDGGGIFFFNSYEGYYEEDSVYNGSEGRIVESIIDNNQATQNGGGIYASSVVYYNYDEEDEGEYEVLTAVNIFKSKISNNSASYGGGISGEATAFTLTEVDVEANYASNEGGGISDYAGTLNYTCTRINNNSAEGSGGGFWGYGSTVNLYRSHVDHNNASYCGGGLLGDYLVFVFVETEVDHNTAGTDGGALYLTSAKTYLNEVKIKDNQAVNGNGGGIYNDEESILTVEHSKFHRNFAFNVGGGLYSDGIAGFYRSHVTHNTAGTDGGGIYNDVDRELTLTETRVRENIPNDISGSGVVYN